MACAHQLLAAGLSVVFLVLLEAVGQARSEEATIRVASEVLAEFVNLREQQIPASLLAEAHAVAIIPDVVKLGFVLGGQHGKGVIVIRQPDGSWRGPMFVTLTGGSIGWQVGAQATDFVLVFTTAKGVEGLQRGKFTLGADAAVAAGPVGRRAGVATDAELKAEIYTYSRSRGLFAGVSLEGSALQIDDGANVAYYGTVPPGGVAPQPPEAALRLVQVISQLSAQASGNVTRTPAAVLSPARDVDAVQRELKAGWEKLSPLLDETWRRYLSIQAQLLEPGRHPPPGSVEAAVKRFDGVASNIQYRALYERPEFQHVHGLLRAYHESLTSSGAAKLALPPPPSGERR